MNTCIVNWFCVNLYSELVLGKLVQYIGFVYICTVNWFCVNLYSELVMYTLVVLFTVVQKLIFWYLYSKLAFLAIKATLEVQKAVFWSVCVYVGTHFAQSWHSDCTKFACWLHKVCTNFAIHQQLVSIKIKFKLSSSQEPSQCLLKIMVRVKVNQLVRGGFVVIYLHDLVGPCSPWVLVLERWKFFPDPLTYVSTWGLQRFLIGGHFILRPKAAWECLRNREFQTKYNL